MNRIKTHIFDEYNHFRYKDESDHDFAYRACGREALQKSDFVFCVDSRLKTITILKSRNSESEIRVILNKIVEKYQYYQAVIYYATIANRFTDFLDFVENEFDEEMYKIRFREFVESHER